MSLEDFKAKMREMVGATMPQITYEGETAIATKRCSVTGEVYRVEMPRAAYDRYCAGDYIQVALAQLTPSQRSFLLDGYTPAEYARIFPQDDES